MGVTTADRRGPVQEVDQPGEPRAGRRRTTWVWRRPAAAWFGLGALLAGLVLDNPVLVLVALVASTFSLLLRCVPTDLALPLAGMALLAVSLLGGLAASAAGVDLLDRTGVLMAIYGAYALLALIGGGRTTALPYGRWSALAFSPAAVLALIGLRQAFDVRLTASWVLQGTDVVQHMVYVHQLQEVGGLDYGAVSYPRAFHMLAALMSVPGRGLSTPSDALLYDLQLTAAATVLAAALVLWTAATVVLRSAAAVGVGAGAARTAAFATASALLVLNPYIASFVVLAAPTSLLASVVLWAPLLVLLWLRDDPRRLWALALVTCASVMLLAHLWQPLALAAVLGFGCCVAPHARRPGRLLRSVFVGPRESLVLCVVGVVSVVVSVVPVLAVQHQEGGLATVAAIPGTAPGAPTPLLVLVLLSVVLLVALAGRAPARLLLGAAGALGLTVVLMLRGTGQGWDLSQYYPQKVVWFLSVLLLPVVVLCLTAAAASLAASGARWARHLGSWARTARVVGRAVVVAVLVAFALPVAVVDPPILWNVAQLRDDENTSRRLDLALAHGVTHTPSVAVPVSLGNRPIPDSKGTFIISKLLSFQTGQPLNHGAPADVCQDVERVGGAGPAVVVSTLDVGYLRRLMTRRGCGDVPIVHVPGGGADPSFLPKD